MLGMLKQATLGFSKTTYTASCDGASAGGLISTIAP
jgi:hypothetical protein